ncbi:acyl-CoA dehydrogenase family protein [Candidatus Bathyarchaeota archaeon]|nr:acyl-CoA dehydrogenase family protein [Candidatus Bathyarchaeota archaeon]
MAGLTTEAGRTKDGKSFVINGQKKWITQGQLATHALCAARTGGPGHKGVTVFIVDMSTQGVHRKKMLNSGVSSSGSTFVDLDNVIVPVENVLGREGQGFEIIMSSKCQPPFNNYQEKGLERRPVNYQVANM